MASNKKKEGTQGNGTVSSLEDHKRAIAEEMMKREVSCGEVITETLKEFNCAIVSVVSVSEDGRIMATPRLKALEGTASK